jgi:hypothetical protein
VTAINRRRKKNPHKRESLVHPEDLSFATMRQNVSEALRPEGRRGAGQNVGEALRQRDLREDEPVIAYLGLLGRTYRENAAERCHGAAPPGARSRTPP